MKVFSIILRIFSLGACGFAVYCWIDKKDLVAQKEAIIQEHELISGFYTKKRGDKETTQDETTRQANFKKIEERDPKDDSLTRLNEIREGLALIAKNDEDFLYSARKIKIADRTAKDDEVLTFQVNILDMNGKIKTQKDTIAKKEDDIADLNKKLTKSMQDHGLETQARKAAEDTIKKRDATIQDQEKKYNQLQADHLKSIEDNQREMDNLRANLKNQQEQLTLQLAAKDREISTIETEKQDLMLENSRLMTQIRQRTTSAPTGGVAENGGTGLQPPPNGGTDIPPVDDGSPIIGLQAYKQHTRVLAFSPEKRMLVLNIGSQQGLKPTMKLRLERNGSTLARLGIIKIDYQPGISFFTVLQSPESEEWQTIAAFKKGDAVTILE